MTATHTTFRNHITNIQEDLNRTKSQ